MINRCRLCGADGTLLPRLKLSGERLAMGQPFSLSRCAECGAWQVAPPLARDFIRAFFQAPERWQKSSDPDGRPVDPIERADARRGEYEKYASAIHENLDERGRALDVGAGTGLMLSLLSGSFQKIAVEPNPVAAELAAGRGLAVRYDWAENLDFPAESFHCLIMNQSFDHLLDPFGFLAGAVHWIRPGGLMLITGLINPHGLMARLYGPQFRLWHPLYQIYPPSEAMARVLGGHGFEVIRWWRPYFGTPYGSFKKLLADSPRALSRLLGRGRDNISPPWPGSTYSLLARKTLLARPLVVPARKWFHLNISPRAAEGA